MILTPKIWTPEPRKIMVRLNYDLSEWLTSYPVRRAMAFELLRRGAPVREVNEMFNLWAPPTGTGKSAGTPVDWAALKAGSLGTTRTVTNTDELNAAMAAAVPGDVVLLSGAGGPWTGQWSLSASGTVERPILVVPATPGAWGARTIHKTADKILINGSNLVVGGFKFSWASAPVTGAVVINGARVAITDVEIDNILYSSSTARMLIISSTAHFCHLHHNRITNIGGMTVAYDPRYPDFATDVIIEYNDFEGTTNKWCQIANEPYEWQDNHDLLNTGVQVRYNYVLNCESQEFKSGGNTVYRNYIEGSTQSGIGLRSGKGNVVEGNYFKSGRSVVRCSEEDHRIVNNVFELCEDSVVLKEGSLRSQIGVAAGTIYNAHHARCEDILIAHNAIINGTGRDIYLGLPQTGRNGAGFYQPYSPVRTKIYGNLCASNAGVRIYLQTPNTVPDPSDGYPTDTDSYHKYVDTLINRNCTYVTGTGVIGDDSTDGGTPSDYINWTDATRTSGTVVTAPVTADPVLSGTYRITGAPCQNAGFAFDVNGFNTATALDWDGNLRTQGAAPDIGVIEVASSTPPATGTYALFAAGFTTANVGTTDRYVYADDTVTAGTTLATTRRQHGGAGNATVAIFGGGTTGSNSATTEQYTFSSDAIASGTALTVARRQVAAVATATVAYFAGGFTSVQVATVDKYTFTGATVAAGTSLTAARDSMGAAGDAFVGVLGGGFTTTAVSSTDRYTYATDALSPGANLLLAREDLAACGNSALAIFGGGTTGARTAVTDKYDHSTTTVSAGTSLGTAREELAAAASATVGYFAGGSTGSVSALVDKYTLATHAVTAGTVLLQARSRLAGASGVVVEEPAPAPPPPVTPPASGAFALFAAGFTTANVATTDRYVYTANTVSAGTALGTARTELAGVGAELNAVFAGGFVAAAVATVEKYTYSGDAVAAGTSLNNATRALAGATTAVKAVFAGGQAPATTGWLYTYTHAANTWSVGNSLKQDRHSLAATGNTAVGMFGGGIDSAAATVATADIYTYAASTTIAGTSLTVARHSLAASSNSALGVFGGGNTGSLSAATDRYVYATDELLSGTSLSTAKEDLASASDAAMGLFCAGFTTVVVAGTEKFAFDANTVSAGTALGTARRGLAGAGLVVTAAVPAITTEFGVFGGGLNSVAASSAATDRYVYASDAVVAGTALGTARHSLAAVSNATVGIFGGGTTGAEVASTDRYTYATNAVTPATALSVTRHQHAGTGNATVGIFAGGYAPAVTVTTEQYTYATDAVSGGAALGTARRFLAAAGNESIGIFAAGFDGPGAAVAVNVTDRYDYGAGIVTPGTALYWLRQALAGRGNAATGAFVGGSTSSLTVKHCERYEFSTAAVTPGTQMTITGIYGASVGDANAAVFAGGAITALTDKYFFANDTVLSGTSLALARYALAGASANVFNHPVLHTLLHGKHRGLCAATYLGLVLVGDYSTGTVYHQDGTYYYDDAGSANTPTLILKRRVTPVVYSAGNWVLYDRLVLEMEAGGLTDPAQFELTWSDDGGVSLNLLAAARHPALPAVAAPTTRMVFRRLGKARWRAWQVDVSAPIRWVLTGAHADLREGGS